MSRLNYYAVSALSLKVMVPNTWQVFVFSSSGALVGTVNSKKNKHEQEKRTNNKTAIVEQI